MIKGFIVFFFFFFAMEDFRLNVQVPMLKSVVNNMEEAGYTVSPDLPRMDNIEVLGILGNDILQYFTHLSLESASLFGKVNAKMVRLANGYIPYGSVLNFLHPDEEENFLSKVERKVFPWIENSPIQSISGCEHFDDDTLHSNKAKLVVVKSNTVPPKKEKLTESRYDGDYLKSFPTRNFHNSSFDQQILEKSDVKIVPPKSFGKQNLLVQFALDPVGYQFDLMHELFPDSNVDYGLDSFYKFESIGIRDTDGPSYKKEQIDLFRNSITYDNGHYKVCFPWKSELMNKVPSNMKVSLAVAERVYDILSNKLLDQAYEEVFEQQEVLGIIEPIENRVPGQTFIPHRPVIKMDG